MEKIYRFFVEKHGDFAVEAQNLCQTLKSYLHIGGLKGVRIFNRYDLSGISEESAQKAGRLILAEPQCDQLYFEEMPAIEDKYSVIAVESLPGQYDQRADSAAQCIQVISDGVRPLVRTAKVYVLLGRIVNEDLKKIKQYLINPVESREAVLTKPNELAETITEPEAVFLLENFNEADESALTVLRTQYGLAMDLGDLRFMQKYFRDEEKRQPSITELRMIDTYWSDHCRHTTFLTKIEDMVIEDKLVKESFEEYLAVRREVYGEKADDRPITLMDMGTIAAKALKKRGILQNLDESEEINACSVKVDVKTDDGVEKWLFMFKNETHNHPTEIEPFGGAATCLGGAIRDPLSGRSYVYQAMRVTGAADPRTPIENTIDGKLPQRQITTLAAKGYASYGNQIGLATGLVDEIYHEGYSAKRMEIGAVLGAAPAENVVRLVPEDGDVIVLLGGRTGRDGCGGATGSSKSHTAESLSTCSAEVQKGNPVEERKIQRLFRRPEISRLIKRCNDFGAGGVSVAIGELADGLHIYLDRVPKKYEGLSATELAISESQERMAVVLAPQDLAVFQEAAAAENLEATVVAYVTKEPRLVMEYEGQKIVDLSREFLNSAGERKTMAVNIGIFDYGEKEYSEFDPIDQLKKMAADLNIASKRGLVEQFDSTIGSGSLLMPFGGRYQLTPTQVMAAKFPLLNGQSQTASLFSYGFDPFLSEKNQYIGAMCAVVESLAKIVAAGGHYQDCYLTLQEYFENLKGDPKRWGKPTAALLGTFQAQMAFGVSAIGGKDSMSGSFMDLNVPPTLVSFAASTIDAEKVLSPEFKDADHEVYLFAAPYDRYGRPMLQAIGQMWRQIQQEIDNGNILSAWAVDFGGAAEGIFKMVLGNQIGFRLNELIDPHALFEQNYGAIIVEANIALKGAILLGKTTADRTIDFNEQGSVSLQELQTLWEGTLEDIFPTKVVTEGEVQKADYHARPMFKHKEISIARPKAVIPVFPGTNCEYDAAQKVEAAGGQAEIVVIANLTAQMLKDSVERLAKALETAQMMILPGGFSFGDEPDGSGKFIATFMRNPLLSERIHELLYQHDGLVLGICNGFQALVKLGLLPYGKIVDTDAHCPTLTYNSIGRHQSRYVQTRIASVRSPWLAEVNVGDIHSIPVSHGEGRFVCESGLLKKLLDNGQIATQYVDFDGNPSMDIAYNPNGSVMAIEGILSPDGRVFGKMGHSERIGNHVAKNIPGAKDQRLFEAGVKYFK